MITALMNLAGQLQGGAQGFVGTGATLATAFTDAVQLFFKPLTDATTTFLTGVLS